MDHPPTPHPSPSTRHFSDSDIHWMSRALSLARRGEGLTRPNPPVGAVIVKDGQCIGSGWHRKAGGPHAEVYALRQAGDSSRGATLYVTLEPCSTYGRTPPCCEAILRSGIARIVAAMPDPNPAHAGRGFTLLRRAGLSVTVGPLRAEAEKLLAPFATHQLLHRPFVTLKLATSLDGRIADSTRRSQWITSAAARDHVQALRRASDIIWVGAGTLRADNPSLWPRPDCGRSPWRIVSAFTAPVPLDSKLFTDDHADRTILAVPRAWHPDQVETLRARGITVWDDLPRTPARHLRTLLTRLGTLGALRILCEGGGGLASSLVRARLVDELILILAPKLLGGPVGAMGPAAWPIASPPLFTLRETLPLPPDLLLRYTPAP